MLPVDGEVRYDEVYINKGMDGKGSKYSKSNVYSTATEAVLSPRIR